MARFVGKSVIVTGAASGIGAATARAFAAEGAMVVLADIADEAGNALAAEIVSGGGTARYLRTDATSEQDQQALVAHAVAEFGRLDIAINNIGNIGPGQNMNARMHEEPLDHWLRNIELNLTSCHLGMKHQVIQMLNQGTGGAIANTAALAALKYTPDALASYSAAKAAVIRLSEFAAVCYAKDDIRVNVVAPGLTATPAVKGAFDEATRNAMAARTQPMGRCIEPEEQADAFLFLCSDAARGITGLTIPVDGGWAAV